jgi:SAM-dependent methyltransferase
MIMFFRKLPEPIKNTFRPLKNCFCTFLAIREKKTATHRYQKNPQDFWERRHKTFDSDMRAVGPDTCSSDANLEVYAEGEKVLGKILSEHPGFQDFCVIEIGCGNGYWAGFLKRLGLKRYIGVDISPYAIKKVSEHFPEFQFFQFDVAEGMGKLQENSADMILMIDVTQHIVDDEIFQSAMANLRRLLKPTGTIVLTSNLSEALDADVYYVKRRPLKAYQALFPDFTFGEPLAFNSKFIFAMDRKETPPA